jgi:hypothetical protein
MKCGLNSGNQFKTRGPQNIIGWHDLPAQKPLLPDAGIVVPEQITYDFCATESRRVGKVKIKVICWVSM